MVALSQLLQKLLVDAASLERRLREDPSDKHAAFNLAQCYANLGLPEEAITWYEKRASMGGGQEEVWYSLYRLGFLYERIEDQRAVDTLVQAYMMRPNRAEPLAALARHFLRKRQWAMAALHASAAMVMSPPTDDRLFIERDAYGEKIREVYVAAALNLDRKVTSGDPSQPRAVKPITPTTADSKQQNAPAHVPAVRRSDARLLGLVMVVKDEVHGITKTLLSAKPYIDYWTILDTGSTDGTQKEILKALDDIPGQLHEEPFVDFSTTYNRALDIHGRTTDFVLHLLGDEELIGGNALRDFVEQDPTGEAFYVPIQQGDDLYRLPRLSRSVSGWRYSGRTHEMFGKSGVFPTSEVTDVVIVRGVAPDEADRKRNRWELDREILEEDLQKNPFDVRTIFYLAQTYAALGDIAKAVELYQMRIDLGGWADEVYESKFRLARCLEAIGRPWSEVQQAYLDAHAFDPRRAEPLFAIAEHWYAQDNHPLAYLFAQRASEIPLPNVRLFVKTQVYENLAANIVSTSAFYVAERTEDAAIRQKGMHAAEKCIAAKPWDEQLRDNRAHYCRFAADLWTFQAKRLNFTPPPSFSPMNPSIAFVPTTSGDRWLCVIRTANYRFLPGGGYEILGDSVQTRNFMAELSPTTFDIVRVTEMVDKADRPRTDFHIHGYEDCRLFWWNGALRVTATACDLTKNGDREIVLCTLDDDYAIVEVKPLRGQWSSYPQKNWMPVVENTKLRFVYSAFPEVILTCRYDKDDDLTIDLPQIPNFAPQRLRGGSQGVRVEDGWLFLVHDVAWYSPSNMPPRTYLHRFVLMDEDLQVVSMSDPFFFIQKGIEFGAGMALVDEQLVVSFGVDDAQAYLGIFHLPEVLESLRADYVI